MSGQVRAALATIVDGGSLTLDEARIAMGEVMDGEATPAQLAAMLMGLRMRGETIDELAGFATAMRERVVRRRRARGCHRRRRDRRRRERHVQHLDQRRARGRRRPGSSVAKHGNRAITSQAGSADVLDALGVRIDHDAASAGEALRTVGLRVHVRPALPPGDAPRRARPAARSACGPRSTCSARSPTRPGPRASCSASATRPRPRGSPRWPSGSGTERTFVIHGDGVDELPLDGSGVLYHVSPDAIERHAIDAAKLGFRARRDRQARRRDAGRERPDRRGDPPRRAGGAARCRGAQRGGRAARRGRRRVDGGGHRPRHAHDRCRAGRGRRSSALRAERRAADAAAAAASRGRLGDGARMTADRRATEARPPRRAWSRRSPARRQADIDRELAASGPVDPSRRWRPRHRSGASSSGSSTPACT